MDHVDWGHLDAERRACRVKANDGRQVWRLSVDGPVVFAKLYMPSQGWPRLRRVVLGSEGLRERRIADYAAGHGIDTVQPIGWSDAPVEKGRPISILLTEGLPAARPLNELWLESASGPGSRRRRNLIIDRVARLIAHAHQNGFEHTDLHAGNVLLEPQPMQDYRCLFVDLHNIRIGRPVSDRGAARNLAQFGQWFRMHATLGERLRFLDRYLHWRNVLQAGSAYGRRLGLDRHAFRRAIEQAAEAHARSLYAKRDRRSLRAGRYFGRLRLGRQWKAHVFLKSKQPLPGSPVSRMALTTGWWQSLLAEPTAWVKPDRRRYVIKESTGVTVCRTDLTTEGGGALATVCKRSLARTLGKRIRNAFRRSRGLRTWWLANALLNRQILTARPLAVVERRVCGLVLDSVIITEHVEHAHDLDTMLTIQLAELPESGRPPFKRRIGEALAEVVRRFHDRGFVHRDFKAPNVMVQWDPAGGDPPRVLLVDLDGIRKARQVGSADFYRAMARLNVSVDHCSRVTLTDRARFLRRCLARPGCPEPDWRTAWREIAHRSADALRRQRAQHDKLIRMYGRI